MEQFSSSLTHACQRSPPQVTSSKLFETLQTLVDQHKRQGFFCNNSIRLTHEDERQRLQTGNNRDLNRGRSREKTGHHCRLPVPKKAAAAAAAASSQPRPMSFHRTWLVFIFWFRKPLSLSVSLELLFGTEAFKLPCIPRRFYRLSWLPSQSVAPAHVRPLLDQRRGGSYP